MGFPMTASASSTPRPASIGLDHTHLQPIDTEPVGNEARTVLATYDALAEHVIREATDRLRQLRIGVLAGDDFHESHVAGGLKKLRNEESRVKLSLSPRVNRRSGIVDVLDERPSPADAARRSCGKRLFHLEDLSHRLDDPSHNSRSARGDPPHCRRSPTSPPALT